VLLLVFVAVSSYLARLAYTNINAVLVANSFPNSQLNTENKYIY